MLPGRLQEQRGQQGQPQPKPGACLLQLPMAGPALPGARVSTCPCSFFISGSLQHTSNQHRFIQAGMGTCHAGACAAARGAG